MELQISEEKNNALFKRKEITATAEAESTPSREEVLKVLTEKFSVPVENIKIKGIHGKFGSKTFNIQANIYEFAEDKETIEIKKKKETVPEKPVEETPTEAPAESTTTPPTTPGTDNKETPKEDAQQEPVKEEPPKEPESEAPKEEIKPEEKQNE